MHNTDINGGYLGKYSYQVKGFPERVQVSFLAVDLLKNIIESTEGVYFSPYDLVRTPDAFSYWYDSVSTRMLYDLVKSTKFGFFSMPFKKLLSKHKEEFIRGLKVTFLAPSVSCFKDSENSLEQELYEYLLNVYQSSYN